MPNRFRLHRTKSLRKHLEQQRPPVTHMCHLVFGPNDSVLRPFAELHIMIFSEGVSEEAEDT